MNIITFLLVVLATLCLPACSSQQLQPPAAEAAVMVPGAVLPLSLPMKTSDDAGVDQAMLALDTWGEEDPVALTDFTTLVDTN